MEGASLTFDQESLAKKAGVATDLCCL